MFNSFLRIFRSRWFRTLLGVAVLAVLVWFFGPLLGLGQLHPLETEIARYITIAILFVLWLFQNLIVISQQYALIVIGALLLVTILYMPGGYIVWLVENRHRMSDWRRRRVQGLPAANASLSKGAAE